MIELLSAIPAPFYVLIGTLFGGVMLKIVEGWYNRHHVVIDEKKDYRDEIKDLRDRLDKVEAEVDEWRSRYYANEHYINILRSLLLGSGVDPPERQKPVSQ